jgi:hypothetical protein
MKWTFQLRGKEVTLTRAEQVVAVRPNEDARRQGASRGGVSRIFGSPAIDTSGGGRFGIDLPSRNRQVFEQAGWVFVEPRRNVAEAAPIATRSVRSAEAVQQVFVDRSGNIQVTTDLLTVQVDPDLSEARAERVVRDDGLRMVRRIPFAPNTFEVSVASRRPLPEVVSELQGNPHYVFAEPMLLQCITGRFKPTDPHYAEQWQHANDGSGGGTSGSDIKSETGWNRTRGRGATRPVRIAVIDNAMQVNHPDLKDGIVGGGYFRSNGVGSANFVRLRRGMAGFPSGRHGTFCMGMAGARANNGRGGCGSAPEADLLAIACLDDQIGTQVTLARAVAFAADPSREVGSQASAADGADVISCSLGPNGADWDLTSVLDLAIRFAVNQARGGRGAALFWAASNGHVELARDEVSSHPDVIAVGRSDRNDQADGSAFGPKLEFLAPGVDVYSTYPRNTYGFGTGTSYATPLAAGVGALVLARHPQWTAQQVRERLRDTCDKVGGVVYDANGHHIEYGFGRVNAARATA